MSTRAFFRKLIPFLLITALSLPIIAGYLWIFISTFAQKTHGLVPLDAEGRPGGLTFTNWILLFKDPQIWILTWNTLILALGLTIGVLLVSCLAAYPLSRIKFPGRKGFLALTMILHAFPSVTLLIAIFFVLRWIAKIPILGKGLPLIGGFGYNTIGGVTLVSIALQLPLGVWLMKGSFDNVSWDIERAALIDGCSRFRTWWQIMIPQIKPGLAALGIFSFMQGWSSFLIPYTFMVESRTAVISTYLNYLTSENIPINYGQVAAIGLFQLLPILLFYVFTQRYLLQIFSGGMKGSA
jgi:inositol-phosphate transport system permease protein